MNYKHCCVVDREGFYKTLVLVLLEPDDTGQIVEKIQYYELNEGEQLLEAAAPSAYVRPQWDGETWAEGATPEEIEAWEQEHPAPPPPIPTPEQQQLAALTLTQAQQDAAISQQEATITQLQQTNAALMLQLAQAQTGGGEGNV